MKPKENYKLIEIGKFEPKGEAFTIAFVFAPDEPLVVKGMESDVLNYINTKIPTCHYKLTKWKNGKKIECLSVNNPNWKIQTIQEGFFKKYHFKYLDDVKFVLSHIPKHFIKEFAFTNTTRS